MKKNVSNTPKLLYWKQVPVKVLITINDSIQVIHKTFNHDFTKILSSDILISKY